MLIMTSLKYIFFFLLCFCFLPHSDDKEYDIYISYARNSEEEQFVLLTLRRVLENELGYTVCIFDRDSLPGGSEYGLSSGTDISMEQSNSGIRSV